MGDFDVTQQFRTTLLLPCELKALLYSPIARPWLSSTLKKSIGSTQSETTPRTPFLCALLEPHGTTRTVPTPTRNPTAAFSLILAVVKRSLLVPPTRPHLHQVSRALLLNPHLLRRTYLILQRSTIQEHDVGLESRWLLCFRIILQHRLRLARRFVLWLLLSRSLH